MKSIKNDSEHQRALAKIEALMLKGNKNITPDDDKEIGELGLLIQNYEQKIYVIELPKTIIGMLEMKMYEFRLKQQEFAKKIGCEL